ncbi:hydrogenase nickel incorporation protein HypB [Photobacterium damselae subsp. piscicida]|uniref:hydrogenase nickel incorporation protein HypB n=1 Tax=Photobacterium damselae TaxID=38293 RepID=UPI0002E03EEF|nr:hydrogenase nickel incorporation protein HypB [Photobacterium damselae]OLQ79000.1 hydrogenase accessory protein HypB [Photobacterium damselae subsp. piscicida]TJZ90127.1 hydrogenase nickel incorporation protein HypB [Photobacterium damselae subsp. piscicida]
MCSVCGCGDSQVEGHTHHHHHEGKTSTPTVIVHHHYYNQGDVHLHIYGSNGDVKSSNAGQGHHHTHDHHDHHDHHPEQLESGDLHYGKGEAQVHVSGVSQRQLLTLEQDILGNNNHLATHNRQHFSEHQQCVLNLVSSPGSGKTTLLTETLILLSKQWPCAVIEGDQQTTNDADRIRATGVAAIQVNTGKGCHLDAQMVHDAYHQLASNERGFIFIENVGNLVCPASFDLGEDCKVAILSVTEGEDKPLKYPNMFAAAKVMVLNKVDLLPYLDFDIDACIANARRVNPQIQNIKLSAKKGEGMEAWLTWLNEQLMQK